MKYVFISFCLKTVNIMKYSLFYIVLFHFILLAKTKKQ